GQDVVFVAPSFAHVLNLKQSRTAELAARIRFAPPEAIEAAAARAASSHLMVNARERTGTIWPDLTAHDLTAGVRRGFAITLWLLILIVVLAGTFAQPALVPVLAVLLFAPGVMRLAAALRADDRTDEPRLLSDAELPIYTVLIPLRDEAAMVPHLVRVMGAI